MNLIAERLKELRKAKNKTQLEVATALNISDAAYRQYEISKRVPAAESLCKLADYFKVSTDYLLGRTDNPNFNK
jgi:transcriptional regulator with XRE-family HTH domain